MSLKMKSTLNLFQKVIYIIEKQGETVEWEKEKVYIYNYINDPMDDPQLEEKDQQAERQPAGERSSVQRAKLFNALLWILMLATIITLTTYFTLEINKVKNGSGQQHLQLSANNSQLQAKILEMEANNSQLQTKLLEMAANNNLLQDSYKNLSNAYRQKMDEVKRLKDAIEGKWCPDGWKRFGCSFYFKYQEKTNWSESRRRCQERGADLVIINSEEEQEFVKKLNTNGESWIGLHYTWIQSTRTYGWRWVDGSPLTPTFWGTRWPRNDLYQAATCCDFEGKWTHAHGTNYEKNWICEKQLSEKNMTK